MKELANQLHPLLNKIILDEIIFQPWTDRMHLYITGPLAKAGVKPSDDLHKRIASILGTLYVTGAFDEICRTDPHYRSEITDLVGTYLFGGNPSRGSDLPTTDTCGIDIRSNNLLNSSMVKYSI